MFMRASPYSEKNVSDRNSANSQTRNCNTLCRTAPTDSRSRRRRGSIRLRQRFSTDPKSIAEQSGNIQWTVARLEGTRAASLA